MIVIEYKVWYRCSNPACRKRTAILVVKPHEYCDVTKIGFDIAHTMMCDGCGWPMERSLIKCDTLKDPYGDESFGTWLCKKHEDMEYWPGPLRKIHHYRPWGMYLTAYQLYLDVIDAGFPWKCPICKEPLTYINDKKDTTFC